MISILFLLFAGTTAVLPLPERARPVCQNCSTKGYDIVPLGDGIWALTDGGYWSLAVLNNDNKQNVKYRGEDKQQLENTHSTSSITLVDCWEGDGFMKAVNEVLSSNGASTVKYLIYSHQHTDHIGNGRSVVTAFPTVTIIAHEETKKTLAKIKDGRRPIPHTTFTRQLSVREAGLELKYEGAAHSLGDITIYHPKSKTLMFVDVIFPRWVPFWNLAITVDIPGFFEVHDKILGYDFKTFVGGHLTRLGDRADVEESYNYIKDVKATAVSLFDSVNFGATGAKLGSFDPTNPNFGNFWYTFNTMLDDGAKRCADQVQSRWSDKLGGIDVFTYSHCWAVLEALRVDFGEI
jgi:glyoxylase-like metal-dependent hydrolase (beta-lactamase superfamily II)